MATLNFPQDPVFGDVYEFASYTYKWDGEKWKTIGTGSNPANELRKEVFPKLDITNTYAIEALRRSYAEAGYKVVSGSFGSGGVLESSTDVLLNETDGKGYAWNGTFPKVVAPGTDPAAVAGFVMRSDAGLRGELASNTGGELIGISSGKTIQDEVNLIHAASVNNFVLAFGGVADYTGTPLYDGNDATRITATDNTPMLLNALTNGIVKNGVLQIHIPSGHYGFKSLLPTISSSFVGATSIEFIGAGKDKSILDFMFEDTSHTAYVNYYDANVLLRLTGFKKVSFVDLTTKCTTKKGPPNGDMSPDQSNMSSYYGAVWFSSCEGNDVVEFVRCDASYGNYYCNFVYGFRDDALGHRGEFHIIDCSGHDNSSCGFAGQFLDVMQVSGGYFYRNGTRGITTVGYGVKAEFAVNNFIINGGLYKENYRKGVDRHSGCGLMLVKGATFIDNLLYDIYDNNWYVGTYYPGGKMNTTILDDNTHIVNSNKPWFEDAMSAVKSGTLQKHIWAIFDQSSATPGALAQRNESVVISNATLKVINQLGVAFNQLTLFAASGKKVEYFGNKIDVGSINADNNGVTADIYTKRYFFNEYPGAETILEANSLTIPDGSVDNKNTFLFQLYGSGGKLTLTKNTLDIKNVLMKCTTSAGDAAPISVDLNAVDNAFLLRDLKLNSFGGASYANALSYLANPFMLASNVTGRTMRNKIGFGDARNIVDWNYSQVRGGVFGDVLQSSNNVIGNSYSIVTPNIAGNITVTLTGGGVLISDKLSVSYYSSSFTKSVHTASTYLSAEDAVDTTIQLNGASTNFKAKELKFKYTANQSLTTGMYRIDVMSQKGEYPAVSDMW